MRSTVPLLLSLTSLFTAGVLPAEESSPRDDWPMYHQDGDYVAPVQGLALVDAAADMRLVFNGPQHMGVGKTSSGGFKGSQAKAAERAGIEAFNGGTTTPVVCEGLVYVGFFRPSGTVVDETKSTKPRGFQLIGADDVLAAIDAETGELRWEAVEPGKGVSRGGSKRTHWGVSPAVADGRVFAMGSTGRLYAYAAESGDKLWETDIGAAHAAVEEQKAEALASGERYGGDSWKGNLVVAAGVLVAPDGWNGLIGFDTATGERLWHLEGVISPWATPAIWRHDGRSYLLVCTRGGELRLLEPATGAALWTETVGTNLPTVVLDGDLAILNIGDVGEQRGEGVYGGIRLSLSGIERLWTLPQEVENLTSFTGADNSATRRLAIREDIAVLCLKATPRAGLTKHDIRLMVLRPDTGEILYDHMVTEEGAPEQASKRIRMPILMEDRVLLPTDQNHGDNGYGAYYYRIVRDGEGRFQTLDFAGAWPKSHYAISGYETPIEIPYVDGRLYFRSMGGIACYDLRKNGAGE